MTYIPDLIYTTYIPDPTVWTDTGINHPAAYTSIIRVGSTLYSFGGDGSSNKIYSAPWNDSTNWTDTLATIPFTPWEARAAIIDGYIYLFGSNSVVDIYRAAVSNPLSWSDTGANLATSRDNSGCVCVVDTKIVIPLGAGKSSVDVANVSSPTIWTSFEPTGGNVVWEFNSAVIDNRFIIYGGFNSDYNCIKEFCPDLTYMNVARIGTLPEKCDRAPEIYHIGNSIWIIGGTNHTYVHEFQVNAPMQQASSYNCLPATVPYLQGGSWIDTNGYLYVISYSTGNRIYRSGRTKVYSEMPPTDGSSRPLLARTEKGEWTVVTKTCRLGFKSWLTNRTDLIP